MNKPVACCLEVHNRGFGGGLGAQDARRHAMGSLGRLAALTIDPRRDAIVALSGGLHRARVRYAR